MAFWNKPPSIVYRFWKYLPARAQQVLLFIGAPKVSMGAAAVISDGQGRILLAHHTYRNRPWALPGGLVGHREQPAEALEREIREELGVEAIAGALLCAETDTSTHHLTLYYQVTIKGLPHCNTVEIDAYRYAAVSEWAALTDEPAPSWLSGAPARPAVVA